MSAECKICGADVFECNNGICKRCEADQKLINIIAAIHYHLLLFTVTMDDEDTLSVEEVRKILVIIHEATGFSFEEAKNILKKREELEKKKGSESNGS